MARIFTKWIDESGTQHKEVFERRKDGRVTAAIDGRIIGTFRSMERAVIAARASAAVPVTAKGERE